jgi:hypothetical protein
VRQSATAAWPMQLHGEAYAELQTLSMVNNFPLFHTCISLAYSSFPFCSDICVLAILKIAAGNNRDRDHSSPDRALEPPPPPSTPPPLLAAAGLGWAGAERTDGRRSARLGLRCTVATPVEDPRASGSAAPSLRRLKVVAPPRGPRDPAPAVRAAPRDPAPYPGSPSA